MVGAIAPASSALPICQERSMKSRPLAERSHSARLWLFKAMALMNRHIKLRQQRRELGGNIANLQRQPDDAPQRGCGRWYPETKPATPRRPDSRSRTSALNPRASNAALMAESNSVWPDVAVSREK